MHKEIIVTIDIGTSKIVAAAGTKDENGAIHILALETEATKTSVRRGRIYSIEEVGKKINLLLNRLNDNLTEKIEKVYVGIGGQSLLSAKETERTVNNEELLQSLCDKCEICHPDIIILGRPAIRMNINTSVAKSDVEIAGYFISPVATAIATLTDFEKNQGCALIEFGAGVTYLSVYKNNQLRYLVTIPIGAGAITKDIACLKEITEEDAEDLKITYGYALADSKKDNNYPKKITARDKEIDTGDFNEMIEVRVDEIIANINNQLERSGFSNALGSGIIITGGGAALKGLVESIEEKTKQKVRIATVKEELLDKDSSEYRKIRGIEETVGLLSLGTENCVKVREIPVEETPVEIPVQTATPIDMFGNPFAEKKDGKRKAPQKKPERGIIRKFVDKVKGEIVNTVDKVSEDLFRADSTDTADSVNEVSNSQI